MTSNTSAAGPADLSPRAMARLAGILLLLTMVLGGVGQSLQGRLLVAGDAAATALRIQTHGSQLWGAFALYMIELSCQIAFTVVSYEMFRPVSRTGSGLAACLSLVGIAIKCLSRFWLIVPTFLLSDAAWLGAFTAEQRPALALLALQINVQGAGVAMIFFGLSALVGGYLILRSTFLPAFLGILGMAAGIGWLAFLNPPFGQRWSLCVIAVGLLGALVKVLWFIVFGVREAEWREAARRAQQSLWT